MHRQNLGTPYLIQDWNEKFGYLQVMTCRDDVAFRAMDPEALMTTGTLVHALQDRAAR